MTVTIGLETLPCCRFVQPAGEVSALIQREGGAESSCVSSGTIEVRNAVHIGLPMSNTFEKPDAWHPRLDWGPVAQEAGPVGQAL